MTVPAIPAGGMVPTYNGVMQPPTTIFQNLPKTWQNTDTDIRYLGIDGSMWHLNGSRAGQEGLTLAPKLTGFMHTPFNSIFSEGPWQPGAVYQRTDWKKRQINFGVMVSDKYENAFLYRKLEERWWRAWSNAIPGFLACFTKTHGWRFLQVQLAKQPDTAFELDPTAFDNNFMQWDMEIVAVQPFWSKKWQVPPAYVNDGPTTTTILEIENLIQQLVDQFIGPVADFIQTMLGKTLLANQSFIPGVNIGEGHIRIWNNGDQPAWPKFLVSAPGLAFIEDGPGTGNMIPLPLLTDADGTCLIDTDPMARTLTCETDPVDPLFFQILSNSSLLDVLLNNTGLDRRPVWQRFMYRFTIQAPPRTLCTYKVYHSQQGGTITAMMPQRFDKAYA